MLNLKALSVKKQRKAKLIIGFIFQKESALERAEAILTKKFRKIDYESPALAFTHTSYYAPEFGNNLKRKFISFAGLIDPAALPGIKVLTNAIETRLSKSGSRLINIDPGYLDPAKVVLASTKDYKHRIYLGRGIFAEITLFYQDKSFRPWEWTYPDYKSAEYLEIFNHIREIYTSQIKDK